VTKVVSEYARENLLVIETLEGPNRVSELRGAEGAVVPGRGKKAIGNTPHQIDRMGSRITLFYPKDKVGGM